MESIKCDWENCKNESDYEVEGQAKDVKGDNIGKPRTRHLCKDCLNKIIEGKKL